MWSIDGITDRTFRAKFLDVPDAMSAWLNEVGGFEGKDVLEFGCGEATAALGIALRYHPRRLVATEIQSSELDRAIPLAREQLGLNELPLNLELTKVDPAERLDHTGRFDIAYSWSVFEHVRQDLIADCLTKIFDVLRPGGYMFLQTTPLYYSAFGSHFAQWIPMPWAHLSMQHNLLCDEIRRQVTDSDECRILLSMYETLNRATDSHILDTARSVGFEIVREHRTYDAFPIPEQLLRIYQESVLRTNQLVFLARRSADD
ncbi:class I SAM-dependent methyltransferase [Paraburkholderia guartelaensis]|uniref:Class I SAM-dependent methyltransferase n=1 Tax=Paraburkholderia guartelaensis TaxID=2546446 RepID=A0A4R5LHZ6_9BURK|nr:class I SAM-dependent methyltransferase [Paraburkholderia guartelaensis]TDG09063.1 class I SAM-dependent methyltransferase [Paraburkholderia guartelaensis]